MSLLDQLLNLHDQHEKKRADYIRAPFPWTGGKWNSLDYLIKYLPIRKVWVDGCGGSGVVTLNRGESQLEVFNDRHSGIVAFFRVLRNPTLLSLLLDRLQCTVFSREEFHWCQDTWESCKDDVERSARWYYMLRCSFGGLGRNFGRSVTGSAGQIRALSKSLDMLPIISSRFKNVQIENLDVVDCLRDYDSPATVSYIDPDYLGSDVGIYKNRVDHEKLLGAIKSARGLIALSGYPGSLYDQESFWDERFEWEVKTTIKPGVHNEGNGLIGKENVMDRNKPVTEVLWIKEAK